MSDCLFCKFVAREIVPDVVAESEHSLAFRDINPQAPTHVLVVPKRHVENAGELAKASAEELLVWASDPRPSVRKAIEERMAELGG